MSHVGFLCVHINVTKVLQIERNVLSTGYFFIQDVYHIQMIALLPVEKLHLSLCLCKSTILYMGLMTGLLT